MRYIQEFHRMIHYTAITWSVAATRENTCYLQILSDIYQRLRVFVYCQMYGPIQGAQARLKYGPDCQEIFMQKFSFVLITLCRQCLPTFDLAVTPYCHMCPFFFIQIYSVIKHYMFRAISFPIIRRSVLYIFFVSLYNIRSLLALQIIHSKGSASP
jgi:hypothetical protein